MAGETCRLAEDTPWVVGGMDGLCLSDTSVSDTEHSTFDADAEPPRGNMCYALASNAYLDTIYVSDCDGPLGSLGRCPVTSCFCYNCCQSNMPPVSDEMSVSVSSSSSQTREARARRRRRMRGAKVKREKHREGTAADDGGKLSGTGVVSSEHVRSASVDMGNDNSEVRVRGGTWCPSEAYPSADQCSRDTDTASMTNDSSASFSSASSSISLRSDFVPTPPLRSGYMGGGPTPPGSGYMGGGPIPPSLGYMGGGCCVVDDSFMLSSSEYDSEAELGSVDIATSRLTFPEGLQGIADTAHLQDEEEESETQTHGRQVLTVREERRLAGVVWHSSWMWNTVISVFLTAAGAFLTGGGIKLKVGSRLPSVYQRDEVPRLKLPAEGERRYRIQYRVALNGHLVMEKVPLDAPRPSEGEGEEESVEGNGRQYLTDLDDIGSSDVRDAGLVGERGSANEVGLWRGNGGPDLDSNNDMLQIE
ncbi:hypothetical protein CBR_g3135 [Chara braunii]|uniref:Uncharacterized protein n=1 Tax=Chara braunii TaxID=69332 RepID=A0A388KEW1_CHABU|nr:hypothetical protein CBR_g3135 [Chara braunii]|eukprot:GBG68590.1 hypothetical protein CBR_g3135 [Chara braunii]